MLDFCLRAGKLEAPCTLTVNTAGLSWNISAVPSPWDRVMLDHVWSYAQQCWLLQAHLVHIQVKHKHTLDSALRDEVPRSDGNVVEQTEA